jgi:hypothetical protein
MKLSRLLLPLLFVLPLLTAQQVGAAHTLRHTLAEQSQQDKHAPHSPACEKCENYAQLGSALSVASFDFSAPDFPTETPAPCAVDFRSADILAAVARGPPVSFRHIA